MSIPNKKAWGVIRKDSLDEEHAYKQFFGLSVSEAQKKFKENALFYQEDLYYMPLAVFSYYVYAYINHIISEDSFEDSDGASAFMSLVLWQLEDESEYIIDDELMKKLIKTSELVSNRQEYYDADVDIYGSFKETYEKILFTHKNT